LCAVRLGPRVCTTHPCALRAFSRLLGGYGVPSLNVILAWPTTACRTSPNNAPKALCCAGQVLPLVTWPVCASRDCCSCFSQASESWQGQIVSSIPAFNDLGSFSRAPPILAESKSDSRPVQLPLSALCCTQHVCSLAVRTLRATRVIRKHPTMLSPTAI
jgi:hypothetical protein